MTECDNSLKFEKKQIVKNYMANYLVTGQTDVISIPINNRNIIYNNNISNSGFETRSIFYVTRLTHSPLLLTHFTYLKKKFFYCFRFC